MVSGMFGLVGVAREAQQGASNVSRFRTGTNLRVGCLLARRSREGARSCHRGGCWKARAGTHGTFRMRRDKEEGNCCGTLAVRVVWHKLACKEVDGFEDKHLVA